MSEGTVMEMEKSPYEQVVVIGRSQLADKCAGIAARAAPWMKILYFNIGNERPPNALKGSTNLEYSHLGKTEIMDFLRKGSKRTLVLSISNHYLFPRDITENPILTMVNLHHAFLPKHPGRNPEIWAIFEGDDFAGITWHLIAAEVDAGEIILQRQLKITEHMTPLLLLRKLNAIAVDSFPEVLDRVLTHEKIETHPQPVDACYKLRYAKERPADGLLSLEWDIDKMYRFVRAMDYGALKVMGDPAVIIDGKKYTWKKYAFSESPILSRDIEATPDEICIRENGKELRLMKIKEITE